MANDRRFQAGLGSEFVRRYKAGKSVSTLIIAQVIQVNYKYNTVDLISVKNKDIMRGAYNTEGAFSAKIPIEFGGRNSAGKPYGQVKPIEVGAMVLVGFVNEDKNNPIVLGIYGNNEVSKQLARAPFSTADYKDDSLKRLANQTFTLYPSLTYDNIDGDGNRVATFTGKTFFVTDNVSGATGVVTDDSQGTDYEDLESSYYANGELIEPMQQQAPNLLFKHQGVLDENGNKDNHNLMFHIASDGTYRTTMMNKEADWRNYFEMTPSGAVRLRRQRDSSMLGEGVLIGEIGIDREGVVYLRNGETDLEVREDGLYSNGEPLPMSVDLSEVLDKLGEHDALFVDMSTQINKTDEKVEILADKTEYYDDKIIDYDAEFVVMADLISSKVSETQVQDMIDDTLIDLTDAIREAQEDADRANQVIADMASDNKITAQEKITLLSEWDLIKNEYPLYIAQAETYEVDSSLYTAKYNAVKNFVEPILADMSATSVVDGALMRKTFSTYYDARLAIITAILRDLKDGIVEAMKDASKAGLDAMDAKAEAINAQLQAQKANELIDDIASDGVLTPVEKSQLKKEWMIVVKEYPTTLAQAEKYELDTADYTAKYNALSVFLQSLLSDMSASSVVDGEQLRTIFSNYYASRVALLKEISDSAKDTLIDYGDRIYVAETAIEQTSESIKLMATKVETIEGDVKTNSALLEVHSEQIRSKVTASEVKDAVDDAINGIQIGTSNLYVIKTQTVGLLNENDGTVGNAVDKSVVSDYIKVKATNPYVASLFENTATNMIIVAWYDSSKVFLSGKAVSGTEDFFQAYKSPEKASYVRVSYKHSDKAKMKFEIGTKPSDYSLSWEDIKGDQDALNDYIQKVEQDAEKAQQEAENAKNSAENANNAIADMSNDNLLTPSEKQQLLLQWEEIQAEYDKNIEQATKFSVSTTQYASAYTALKNLLTPLLADLTVNSVVIGSTIRSTFKTYYDRRTTLLNRVAEIAKSLADTAQDTADKLNDDMNNIGGYNYVGFSSGDNMYPRLMIDNVGYYSGTNANLAFSADKVSIKPKTTGTAWGYYLGTTDETKARFGLESYRLGDIETGKWLTFTANVQTYGGNAEIRLYTHNGGSNWLVAKSNVITPTSGLVRITAQAQLLAGAKAVALQICPASGHESKTTEILFSKVQLEVGIRPTPWKKSDIDIQEDINNVAKELQDNIDNAVSLAEQAQIDADKAQESADTAKANADKANNAIADIASDNKVTAVEKKALKKEWDTIVSEYPEIVAQATKFSVAYSNYSAKYTALNTFITPILTDLATTSAVVGATLRSTFKVYYDERTKLLNAVATRAKELADSAQARADQAVTDASKAQETANSAKTNADKANSAIADIANDNKVTAVEKKALKKEWDTIVSEKPVLIAQASKFGVTPTNYTAKYTALETFITPILADLTSTSTVTGATLRSTFKAYYDERTALLNVIAVRAKELAEQAQAEAEGAGSLAQQAQDTADKAVVDAKNAQDTANTAKTNADKANNAIADIASDNKVTAVEKKALKKEWDIIVSEKPNILEQATKFGVVSTTYSAKYTALETFITPILASLSTTSAVTGATLRSTFKAYYDERTALLNAIAVKAKELADKAQEDATNAGNVASQALSDAKKAQETADSAKTNADKANSAIADIANDNKVTAVEKKALKKEWDTIVSEKPVLIAQASKFGVTPTNYTAKYTALETFITPILANLATTSAVTGTTLRSTFKSYYDERTALLNVIAVKAKELADKAQAEAEGASSSAKQAQETADKAVADAKTAQTTADTAKANADKANNAIADIASDNKVTAVEKKALKKEWDTIVSEKPTILEQATKFGVASTNYSTKYTALETFITPILANLATTSAVTGTTLRATFKAYYDERTKLLNAVAVKAKELADKAQSDATNAGNVASQAVADAKKAQDTADKAVTDASKANSAIADMSNDNVVTPTEKKALKKEWEIIVAEKPKNDSQATNFGVSNADYTAKYNALNAYITPILENLTVNSTVVGQTMRNTFKAYYTARTELLNAIAVKAKELADNAQNAVDSLKATKAWANSADGTVDFTLIEPRENLIVISQLVNGTYDQATGLPTSGADLKRNTVPIILESGASYVVSNSKPTKSMRFFFYDADGGYVSNYNTSSAVHKITIPSNAVMLNYVLWNASVTDGSYVYWKLEKGSTPTIYTPAPSEDPVGSVMKYVGTSIKPSNDPKDFVWVLNSDYVNSDKQEQINGKEGTWIYQPTAPTNPSIGMVWVDTTKTPYQPKRYTGDETGWVALTPEEVADLPWGEDGSNLADWVAQAEQIISADSIINTVLGSEDFTSIFDSKASTEDLTGLASYDDLDNMQAEYERILEEGINGIDFSPYVTNSELEQLKDSFNFTVQQAGGVNMLRNSLGFSGMDFWDGARGENLLKKSGTPVTTSDYLVQTYDMSEIMRAGETYTISLKGALGAGKKKFGAWLDSASYNLAFLEEKGGGIHSATFESIDSTRTDYSKILIYAMDSTTTAQCSVEWVKLEKGSTATPWTPHPSESGATSLIQTIQNDDLSNLGFGSGFQIDHYHSAVLQQNVQLPEAQTGLMYGMSFYMNVQATAKGVTAGVKIYESGTLKYTVGLTDSSDTLPTDYNRYALVFEPESTDITIELFVNNGDNANVIISGVMLNIGNLALKWQPYPSEIYNTNVKIDINGITVRNNQTDGYTMITPQEFSGYARVNGEMERIFTLNGEVTEVRMLRAEQRITMEPITIFAMDNEINRGWAFVSSSES